MLLKLRLLLCVVAMLGVVGHGDRVFAQARVPGSAKPPSQIGGYAGSELGSIYRDSIGVGYSSSSLNRIALENARAQVPYAGQQTTSSQGPSRIGVGVGTPRVGKPFSGYSSTPTVSPYLNLFRDDLDGSGDFNYQTLVRPMLQQQQYNQQAQRQSLEISRRLQAIAAQGDFNAAGSKDQYPTGHQTVFQYYGHHYPAMNAARPRR